MSVGLLSGGGDILSKRENLERAKSVNVKAVYVFVSSQLNKRAKNV